MPPDASLPDWLTVRDGASPVIVYAPHGGRRARPVRRGDSVNDLYTAELALELAERLDASALVNHGLDRNDTDLNRISDLTGEGSPVLTQLRRLVERAGQGASVPLVLFVHGWNIAAPWCDVGVGITESAGELRGRYPTVSRRAFDAVVKGITGACQKRGLCASVGHYYPASGRDNATQLFSGRYAEHSQADVAWLSALAAEGQVDGVQLELGISLRWQGWRRRELIDLLTDVVGADLAYRAAGAQPGGEGPVARTEWSLPPRQVAGAPQRPEQGYSLQAVLADGSGLFVGAEPTGAHALAARLCLARPDGTMLLFVAEGPWNGSLGEYAVAGFKLAASTPKVGARTTMSVSYEGPMVRYPTHDAFLDLEKGLAGSAIAESHIDLELDVWDGGFGELRGHIRAGDEELLIDTVGVCERGSRGASVARSRARLFLLSGESAPCRFEAEDGDESLCFAEQDPDGSLRVALSAEGAASLEGEVTVRVPLYRELPGGIFVKITFGVVRFASSSTQGAAEPAASGLFERIELLGPPRA